MDSALGNIKHVIVLMFENRSFDHILGAMPGADGLFIGGVLHPEYYNTMKPHAQKDPHTNPAIYPTPIIPGTVEAEVIVHGFNHEFGDGMSQDLYGPDTTGIIQSRPQNNKTTYPKTSAGFLSAVTNSTPGTNGPDEPKDPSVMTYFEWGSMRVFHTLAHAFVTCDAWHCDMPGHTSPNRAFMHCATTGDLGINDNDKVWWPPKDNVWGPGNQVNRTTIYERIQQQKLTWKMYFMGSNCDTNWLNGQVFSQQYDPNAPWLTNVTHVPLSAFFDDLHGGTLPFYSFIMCWNDTAIDTSMHPSSSVQGGENLLACIYNAFSKSSHWDDTLLIVNFDESGGIYDHVDVPKAPPPDFNSDDNQPPPVWSWQNPKPVYSYDFTTLGQRIPVLLISPWLNPGVCNNPYQNTSILRFLQDFFGKVGPVPPPVQNWLTHRDQHAHSIAPVFDYTQFGAQTKRTEYPTDIPLYADSITCATIRGIEPTSAAELAAKPRPDAILITNGYLRPLPGHPDSGKRVDRDFASVAEMRAYAKERTDAALAFYAAQRNGEAQR